MFYPAPFPVPTELETKEFVLLPLTPAHVELDYTAVMSNREMLRQWSGSAWPADDFSLNDNLHDLEWHYREHQERTAFTYTVLNPAQDVCLGCVYVRPLGEVIPTAVGQQALARFWVIQTPEKKRLARQLLDVLIRWFQSDDWALSRVMFHTPVGLQTQIDLFLAAGCQIVNTINMPSRGGDHHFFACGETV